MNTCSSTKKMINSNSSTKSNILKQNELHIMSIIRISRKNKNKSNKNINDSTSYNTHHSRDNLSNTKPQGLYPLNPNNIYKGNEITISSSWNTFFKAMNIYNISSPHISNNKKRTKVSAKKQTANPDWNLRKCAGYNSNKNIWKILSTLNSSPTNMANGMNSCKHRNSHLKTFSLNTNVNTGTSRIFQRNSSNSTVKANSQVNRNNNSVSGHYSSAWTNDKMKEICNRILLRARDICDKYQEIYDNEQ